MIQIPAHTELDASVQGWINHVRFADSWGLRRHVLGKLTVKPGRRKIARRAARAASGSEDP